MYSVKNCVGKAISEANQWYKMQLTAANLEFEKAVALRDEVERIREFVGGAKR